MKIRLCQKLIKDFQLVQPSLKSVKEKRLRVFPASLELSVGSELKCWKLSFWHIQSSYLEIFYSTSPTFEILRFHYLNLSISSSQISYVPFLLAEKLGWQKLWSQICLQTALSLSHQTASPLAGRLCIICARGIVCRTCPALTPCAQSYLGIFITFKRIRCVQWGPLHSNPILRTM